MSPQLSVLVVTTQTWLQITRLALRFAEYGCRLSVICPDESHLTYAPHIHKRFRFRLGGTIQALRHAIVASGAEYVVPTDDLSVWFLHELADEFPSFRAIVERSLGERRFFPTLRSRMDLLSLADRLGISVPKTERIASAVELERWCPPDHPPIVLKKDGTWGGKGVQVAHTAEQAQQAFELLATETSSTARILQWLRIGDRSAFTRLRCLSHPEITVQAFVGGVPANSMYACHQGRILGEVQARVVASKGKKGPSLVIQLINDARISRAGYLLADTLKLSGFFGLDFMLDAHTGEPLLIELNPRSTQLGHLAVAGQADLAGLLWSQWTGAPAPAPGELGLSSAVCFYPEGERLTQETASLSGCRSDVLAHESETLATLAEGNPALRTRLRGQLWRSLARLKSSLQSEAAIQAFYYRDFTQCSDAQEPVRPEAARRANVLSIAS